VVGEAMWSMIPLIFSNTPVSARTASVILGFGPRPAMTQGARLALSALTVTLFAFAVLNLAGARDGEAVSAQGIWAGQYGCAQGMTGLTLTVTSARQSHLRALFHFYADPSEPSVPEGCFAMEGAYDSLSGHVELHASDWIERPDGYVTVDLSGEVSSNGDGMSGTVIGPSCTKFALRRVAASARARSSCPTRGAPVSVR
jgi:hypothetical protein